MFDSAKDLLPGLLPAAFRGVPFFVPNTSTEVGRRVAEHLFPGIDPAAYDDFGVAPSIVNIDGMMVGDDYKVQARALSAAFEVAGPGTLIHPWLGPMTVILESPAEISFSAIELRVARFNATFKRVQSMGLVSGLSTASQLINAALSLISKAASLSRSPSRMTISRVRSTATQRSAKLVSGYWAASSGIASAGIKAALPAVLPATPATFAASTASITAFVSGIVPDLGGAPAVSPSAELTEPVLSLTARQGLDICMGAAEAFLSFVSDAPSQSDSVMLIGAAGDALGQAAQLAVHVDYASTSEALELRSKLVDCIDSFNATLYPMFETAFASEVSDAIRTGQTVRLRLIADINETIGRLPKTLIIETDRQTDAFQIANHIYGDRPEQIESGYASIVARNRPRHPAGLPAGRIEVIK